jgi:hypothetical protein
MKKIFNIIIIIFILALSLGSCTRKTAADDTSSSGLSATNNIQFEVSKLPPTVLIGRATDEILSKYNSFYEYSDSSNGEKILIWTDITLKNFDFISIGFNSAGGNIFLFPEKTLYSVNELPPEKPFVVKMLVSEGIPSLGISYLDENNAKKYFYISESGKDGSLSLVEFNNDKRTSSDVVSDGNLKYSDLAGLPFYFSSGAGAWSTAVEILPDGAFSGYFYDRNMGEKGNDYPNGTMYECSFRGRFSPLKKINDYEYSMKCELLTTTGAKGGEKIVDGLKIINAGPYGFDNADEFLLYLPGKKLVDLSDEFLKWVHIYSDSIDPAGNQTLAFYGLYNVADKTGFRAE